MEEVLAKGRDFRYPNVAKRSSGFRQFYLIIEEEGIKVDKPMGTFENVKYCEICHRPLPLGYENDLCPVCKEEELFSQVRDYIRANDVNEYDVAEHFDISLRQVKGWIREGRIEYKTDQPVTITPLHCVSCGEPIAFGSYCQTCYKLKHTPKATYVKGSQNVENRMRYLEADND